MTDQEALDAVKAQFVAHLDPLLAREVRRLRAHGALLFDDAPLRYSGVTIGEFLEEARGFCAVETRAIDAAAFEAWWAANPYDREFPAYVRSFPDPHTLRRKAFEHWLSLQETAAAPDGDVMDVGCATSPFHAVALRDIGARCFRADLPLPEYGYRPGVNGDVIGCSADAVPLPDGALARIFAHNAIEHFEGAVYEGFFREAARLLAPGGMVHVGPLFVARNTFTYVSLSGVFRRLSFPTLPRGVPLVYSDKVGQPYALQIDAAFLRDRIVAPNAARMAFAVVHHPNHRDVGCAFALSLIGRRL